jgi:hypothetical protein
MSAAGFFGVAGDGILKRQIEWRGREKKKKWKMK